MCSFCHKGVPEAPEAVIAESRKIALAYPGIRELAPDLLVEPNSDGCFLYRLVWLGSSTLRALNGRIL
jgi:hypothetical protein